ncbi:MAG: TIM barrel protein, partial [Chloroflexota bacterium]
MRLGAPVFDYDSPETWINQLKEAGYRAAYCPIDYTRDSQLIRTYQQAAHDADIVIAEVGAWNNPISPDTETRKLAIEKCKRQLALADEIGAVCCVNISGSRHPDIWDAPHADNLTADTFALVVDTVRDIIDAVQPKRAFYTLEAMPYAYPDNVDSYLQLIRAIDRPAFGVHLDIVNWINSPRKYFNISAFIESAFARLGTYVKSCHVKDILLTPYLPV